MKRKSWPHPLAASIAALLFVAAPAPAQTFTSALDATFSDPLAWNFGVGPVPASDPALALTLESFGPVSASNDLNLTLTRLDLATYGSGQFSVDAALLGSFAFTGGAGRIELLGSGTASVLGAPIVLGQGLSSLTFAGAGASGTTTGVIASNTALGAPLIIATEARNEGTGVIVLDGRNTFSGGVVLESGTLAVGGNGALGARTNELTVNGGNLRSSFASTVANRIALNDTLHFNGALPLTLAGTITGSGGVASHASAAAGVLNLAGINSYTGATTVGGLDYAAAAFDRAGALVVTGAAGSILHTSGVEVGDGASFRLHYGAGHSSSNSRVSTTTSITVTSGFLEVLGNAGLVRQELGTVNAGGPTTILAATNGGGTTTTTGAETELRIGHLVRSVGATVTFSGPGLGTAAVALGLPGAKGNILLTEINGAPTTAALVGGGGAPNTPTVSILPWALGGTSNASNNATAGTGFVTYGANGVRLLNTATEYNTSNNFNTAGATDNMRIAGSVAARIAPATVNSLFFASSRTVGGADPLTIASGALASNVAAATVSAPVTFGPGGAGEGIVSVLGSLGTTNTLTLSGPVTADALVKSGPGRLVLSGVGNRIAGGIDINGGQLLIASAAQLGGAASLAFHSQSFAADRTALVYTSTAADVLSIPVATHDGMAGFTVSSAAATLRLASDVSGAGGIRKDGAGLLVLEGANTYRGGTYLGAGGLEIDSDARLGEAAGFLGLAGGTLRLSGAWLSDRAITVDGTTNLDTGSHGAVLSGPITSFGTLVKQGAGTLAITGADNGYQGTLQIGDATSAGGMVALSGAGALHAGAVRFGATAAGVPGAHVLDLSGATSDTSTPWRFIRQLDTANGFAQPHEVRLGASSAAPVDLRVSDGAFGGAAGVIGGFGKLVKMSSGYFTLNGSTANTFTGGVEIRGGTLAFSADGQLGEVANALTIQGGTLRFNASATTARAIELGGGPLPLVALTPFNEIAGDTGLTLTLNGTLSGTGGLWRKGGTIVLGSPANTYQGDTHVSFGALSFSSDAQLGASTSRLRLNQGYLHFGAAPTSPTVYPIARTIALTATSTFEVTDPLTTLELSGQLFSAPGLLLYTRGRGSITITGDQRSMFGKLYFGDTNAQNGALRLNGSGHLRRAGIELPFASQARFEMEGLNREIGDLSFYEATTIALGNGGSLTAGFNNANMTWTGDVTGDGAASLRKVGTGTLDLISTSANWSFGGGIHLQSGTGKITLRPAASLPVQSAFTLGAWGNSTNTGPTVLLSRNSIADTQTLHSNGSEIQFALSGFVASEIIGSLRGAGMTTITMNGGGTLAFADPGTALTRVDRGTFLFRAADARLGSAAPSITLANATFGNLGPGDLIGGGGGPGSTTIGILPSAIGGVAVADSGSTLVTYGANGLRPLTVAEFQSSLAGASPTENVRLSFASPTIETLSGGADRTVNSLVIAAGDANTTRIESAATEKLIVTSGTVLHAGQPSVFAIDETGTVARALGVQVAELRTGAGNSRELNVFVTGGESGGLALGAKVTTTGGLTKSGDASLFLTNPANTYTGPTTVNAGSLVLDDLAALGGSDTLLLGGGFLKYRGPDATLTPAVRAAGGSAKSDGGSAGIHVVSDTTLTIPAGGVSGYGGILKDGTGVLKLRGANMQSGATIIRGGALAIDNPAALGTNARVIFADGLDADGGQVLRFDAPMTLAQDFITHSAQATIGFGFDTAGHDVTLTGTLLSATSTRGLYKFGAGELNLTAHQMYTGPTAIFGGTLRLSGPEGSIVNGVGNGHFTRPNNVGFALTGSVLLAPGAGLVLDNAAANHPNRLPDVWDTPFGNGNLNSGSVLLQGGELKIIGHATGTHERVNVVQLMSGTVTLDGAGTVLTSGRLYLNRGVFTDDNIGVGLVRGTNLGGTPGPASTNWFVSYMGRVPGDDTFAAVRLFGAGGAVGTPFVNVNPGMMGDASAGGVGTDLLTYSADVGFRLLRAVEYTSVIPAGNLDPYRAPNISLDGAASLDQTTLVNALKLESGASLSGSGSLRLYSGTVLATGAATIDVPSLQAAYPSLTFLTPGAATTLTVNSLLPTGPILKYGEGTLLLNGRVAGIGDLVVAQGTLRLGGAEAALTPYSGNVTVGAGATLDLGGRDHFIPNLLTTALLGNANLGQVHDGTIALGAGRLTLGGDGSQYTSDTFTGRIVGSGGLTKAFTSTDEITFTQPLEYTGSTILRGGTLTLSGAGALTGTSGVEIRGGTLLFDNSDDLAAAGGYMADRLRAGTPITIASGSVQFFENPNAPGDHTLGDVTIAGAASIAIWQNPGVSAPSKLTIGNLIRQPGTGTLDILAAYPGHIQSPVGNTRIFLTQINGNAPAAAFIGGGGGVGSTTQNILPWAWHGDSWSFFTYGAQGLRSLAEGEYAGDLNAAGIPDANVRTATTSPTTLTAARTVNSANVNGDVTGPFDLTVQSGAFATRRGEVVVGESTHALLTGEGNTRELVMHAVGSATLHYRLTTSGGVTLRGGPFFLRGDNSFTGGLSIQGGAVSFTADAQLGAPGGSIRFSNSDLFGELRYNGPTPGVVAFSRPVETESLGTFAAASGHRWKLSGPISGPGGIGYSATAASVFEITGANTYTGPTVWGSGHLYIDSDAAFGRGGELILRPNNGESIVLRGDWTTSRPIRGFGAIQTNGYDAQWSGVFPGALSLIKNGEGVLSITEGGSGGSFTVNAGSVRLAGRAGFAYGSPAVNAGATFTLDNRERHFDRLADTAGDVALNGGELELIGNPQVAPEEVFRNFSVASSAASALTLAPGAGQAAVLRIGGTVTIGAGASLWRGTPLGVNAPGVAGSANVLLTPNNVNVFPLVGGGAPAGHPAISVVRGGFGDTSAAGLGTQLVTYDVEKGVRLLDPATEFTGTVVNGMIVNDNVRVDGADLALAQATTINALWLKDGASVSGAGVLTISAGSVLVTGAGNFVSKPLTAGANALAIGGPGEVAFTAGIPATQTGGLIKMGAGTLTLEAASSYTGPTILTAGAVNVGHGNAFGATTVQLQGAELRNSSGSPLLLANHFVLNGPMLVGGTGEIGIAGSVTLNHATREFRVGDATTTQLNGIVAASQSLVNYGVTKTGPGLLSLANDANTYDGPTTIREGVLRVDALADGGAVSGLGAGFAEADKLVLDGGTLRYAGPTASTDRLFTLTENGGSIDSAGMGGVTFTNPGALAVTGSGPRTLTLTGSAAHGNALSAVLADGAGPADRTSLAVDTATWTTTAAHTHTGATTVAGGGMLRVIASGSIAGSTTIALADAAAKLDVSSVTGGASFDGTRFTLRTGQTLRGSGSVLGPLSIGGGASIAPFLDGALRTLRTGDLFWTAPDATFLVALDWDASPAVDLLAVGGTVSISNSKLELLGVLPLDAQTFLIVENDGVDPVAGAFGAFGVPAGYTASVDYAFTGLDALGRLGDGNDIAVTLIPVPEPAAAALLIGAMPLLWRRCLRRQK